MVGHENMTTLVPAVEKSGAINIQRLYKVFMPFFRKPRMRAFMKILGPTPETVILDVGGLPYNWELVDCPSRITLFNLHGLPSGPPSARNFRWAQGSGTRLPYLNDSYDIVYSNSVIEHLGSFEQQKKFAAEVRRVGKKLWVQTPARGFFVEPHLITPFIHFMPRAWQRRLLRNFTVWGWLTRPTQVRVDDLLQEIRLLSLREMKALFPDCRIRKERFFFMTKAYIAIRT